MTVDAFAVAEGVGDVVFSVNGTEIQRCKQMPLQRPWQPVVYMWYKGDHACFESIEDKY